jgi:hypothetical protein
MTYAELIRDICQAVYIFKNMEIDVKGFRAPWLIANKNAYRAAESIGLKYVSNIKAKRGLQRFDGYSFVQLPIYLDDQTLLEKNPVEALLKSSKAGRVFGFHLLYVRQNMDVLDEFLGRLNIRTATLSQIAEGQEGLGLSFDIAYLSRVELIKKLFY